ncbi:MAG: hypothetical protein C4332_00380 [Meiothermus sp.]
MSECAYLHTEIASSGPRFVCGLKQEDEVMKGAVYLQLFGQGLEARYPNEHCPIAVRQLWAACPFRYVPLEGL